MIMTATCAPTGILDPGVSCSDMQTYASVLVVSFLDDIEDVLAYAKICWQMAAYSGYTEYASICYGSICCHTLAYAAADICQPMLAYASISNIC